MHVGTAGHGVCDLGQRQIMGRKSAQRPTLHESSDHRFGCEPSIARVRPTEDLVDQEQDGSRSVLEGILALLLLKRVRRVIADTQIVGVELGVLRHGLELLSEQHFASAKLRQIVTQIGSGAAARLKQLERLTRLLDERNKDWFYIPSLLLLVGTQTAMAIENWRAANRDGLLVWLDAWGEFEALSALACYAFERQETTSFPDLTDEAPVFEAQGLGHPLLSREERVCNDFVLNSTSRFFVISGSNMAGKSTFLRAVGSRCRQELVLPSREAIEFPRQGSHR